jgi:hypothetical protein
LILLDNTTFNPGPKTLDLRFQSPPVAPGPAGLTAITSLMSKNWEIFY